MASMKYCDKHNQVGFLKKPEESVGFAEIVDFLKGSHIRTLELRATIDTLERVPRPLLPAMLPVVDQSTGPAAQAEDQPSSSGPLPSTSQPTPVAKPTPALELTNHPTSPSPEPDNEPTEHTFEQPSPEHQPLSPRQEPKALQSQDPSHPHVPEARSLTVEYLLHMVPTLIIKG
ncbi:hypothetical protein Tco_0740389 [Tanacetum coccineum]